MPIPIPILTPLNMHQSFPVLPMAFVDVHFWTLRSPLVTPLVHQSSAWRSAKILVCRCSFACKQWLDIRKSSVAKFVQNLGYRGILRNHRGIRMGTAAAAARARCPVRARLRRRPTRARLWWTCPPRPWKAPRVLGTHARKKPLHLRSLQARRGFKLGNGEGRSKGRVSFRDSEMRIRFSELADALLSVRHARGHWVRAEWCCESPTPFLPRNLRNFRMTGNPVLLKNPAVRARRSWARPRAPLKTEICHVGAAVFWGNAGFSELGMNFV